MSNTRIIEIPATMQTGKGKIMPSENYAWLPTVASAPRKKNSKAALKHRSCIIPKKSLPLPNGEIAGIYADDGISGVH